MGQRKNSESPMGVTFCKLLGLISRHRFGSVVLKAMIQERLSQLKCFIQEQCMCIFSLEILKLLQINSFFFSKTGNQVLYFSFEKKAKTRNMFLTFL